MTMNRFAAAAILLSISLVTLNQAYAQDLYLIIGQSNAAGRDTNIEPSGADSLTSSVKYFTDDFRLLKARQPLNRYSSIRKGLSLQGVNLGLEFGKEMKAATGEDTYLVVNARGGTKVAQWRRGNSSGYFADAVARVATAESMSGARLKGILWHQGEGNVRSNGTFTNSYFNSLRAMIEEFRSELGDVPFIVGQLVRNDKNEAFNDALKEVDDNDFGVPNVDWVTSRNLTTFDGTHFDASSTRLLGRRYADIMLQYVD